MAYRDTIFCNERSHIKEENRTARFVKRALIIFVSAKSVGGKIEAVAVIVVHCCNLSRETLLFGQMEHWLLV